MDGIPHPPEGGSKPARLTAPARQRWAPTCSWPSGQGGSMKALWQAFSSDESGQGLVEYALIIALVAVGLIAILLVLRNSIGNVFNNAATQLNNAPANPYP
jgi:pilus assembly protein Flp/PilA